MSDHQPFSSQLSIDGFALCQPAGVVPVSQVMGSCVFYLGSTSIRANIYPTRRSHGQVRGGELTGITAGFNDARRQALERLRAHALACGAHAVLDVRVRRQHLDSPAQSVEYIASGTAVRIQGRNPPAELALVALSLDDYWKLVQAGYEPVGIAAASLVYETAPSLDAMRALAGMRYSQGRATREIPEFSATVSGAIGIAVARAGESARRWKADHIVGLQIERELEAVDRENTARVPVREPGKRKDLRVIVHVLGTAICDCRSERGHERTERGTWREIDEATASSRTAIDTVLDLNRAGDSSDTSTVSHTKIEQGNLDARRDQK
jgi:uncharacterized protein YbjQ (UPF0145 family)